VDATLAVAAAIAVVGCQLVAPGPVAWVPVSCLVVGATAVTARRRHPLAASVSVAAALVLVAVSGQARSLDGAWSALVLIPFDLAFGLGSDAPTVPGIAGVLLLVVGLQATSAGFNPLFEVVSVGAWAAGRVAGSRRRIVVRLRERNRELLAQRAEYAAEQVAHERARIARDLHDIVAHRLSLIVVQAAAAQRARAASAVSRALGAIVEAASQAEDEIALVASAAGPGHEGRDIDALVGRARAMGVAVRYTRATGDLTPALGETAYRVVQEGLTNAVKHAPGAQVTARVVETDGDLDVEVTTTRGRGPDSALEGGGRGLRGLQDRVAAHGGEFTSSPTPDGGWRIAAVLPRTRAEAVPRPGTSYESWPIGLGTHDVRRGSVDHDHVEAAWAVDPLDPVELDVAGGRRAADPGERT
jgi:signal transduction histidine kinase